MYVHVCGVMRSVGMVIDWRRRLWTWRRGYDPVSLSQCFSTYGPQQEFGT